MPRVSVVMPVFNVEASVADAVRSILGQTFVDFELIVVDDGSSDGTCAVVESITDPRLTLVRLPVNGGIAHALNHGLRLARGELIARMDGDDIARSNRLERQVALMDADDSVAVCGSWVQVIGRPGLVFRFPTTNDAIRAKLRFECTFTHPAVMFRPSLITSGEFVYDPAWVPTEDFELWVRLARDLGLKFVNIPEVLLDYRLPGLQRSEYVLHQRQMATELVLSEACRCGLVAGDEESAAFRSLVTLDPPAGDGWGHVAGFFDRWSTDHGEARRELRWRWGQLLRRTALRELPHAVKASRRLGPTGVAGAVVLIPYGVVRRTAAAEWAVSRLKLVLSVPKWWVPLSRSIRS